MKRVTLLSLSPLAFSLLACLPLASGAAPGPAGDCFQAISFDEAVERAAKEKKLVLVDFFTTWCGPCKMLDQTTWKDPAVCSWLAEATVPIKVDAEKVAKVAQRYGIRGYPTIVILKPDGVELDRLVGYRSAADFLPAAKEIAAGRSTIGLARKDVEASPEDPRARMKLGDALAQRGLAVEALNEYLWAFDRGGKDEKFAVERRTRLLASVSALSRANPAAPAALRERRDALRKALLAGTAGPSEAEDFAALASALGEQRASLALYDDLKAQTGDTRPLRAALLADVGDQLILARRYQDYLDDIGDAQGRLEALATEYEARKTKAGVRMWTDPALEEVRIPLLIESGRYYGGLLGTGKLEDARKLADWLVEFDSTARIYLSLMRFARHAGLEDEARRIGAKGVATLKGAERVRVEQALS